MWLPRITGYMLILHTARLLAVIRVEVQLRSATDYKWRIWGFTNKDRGQEICLPVVSDVKSRLRQK
jgi:hypothetical protein